MRMKTEPVTCIEAQKEKSEADGMKRNAKT